MSLIRRRWSPLCLLLVPLLVAAAGLPPSLPSLPSPPSSAPAASGYSLKPDMIGNPYGDFRANSAVPMDRGYDQFTAAQKQLVRNDYVDMPPDDEPPFPARGLGPMVRRLGKLDMRESAGEYAIVVTVEPDGLASEIRLVHYANVEFAKAMASVLIDTRYKPGICGGQPCRMQWVFRYEVAGGG